MRRPWVERRWRSTSRPSSSATSSRATPLSSTSRRYHDRQTVSFHQSRAPSCVVLLVTTVKARRHVGRVREPVCVGGFTSVKGCLLRFHPVRHPCYHASEVTTARPFDSPDDYCTKRIVLVPLQQLCGECLWRRCNGVISGGWGVFYTGGRGRDAFL